MQITITIANLGWIHNYCAGQKTSGASNSTRTSGASNNTVYIYVYLYIYIYIYNFMGDSIGGDQWKCHR